MTTLPFELAHLNRRVIVAKSRGDFAVSWFRDSEHLGTVFTASEEHADDLAYGWLLHGIAPRSQPTLTGMPACVLP
jgi:hypothetical protein